VAVTVLSCAVIFTMAIPVSAAAQAAAPPQPSAAKRFVLDVAGDYRHFFSKETAVWYGGGLASAGLLHLADENIRDAVGDSFAGGRTYGGPVVQPALAAGWWIVGRAVGSTRASDAGRDLVRAQISSGTWTTVLKVTVNRTRPNGGSYSFPSGHTSATFATAMVLRAHYGWKLGAPAFAAATYTALSRIGGDEHWASDVVFGAVVGMASARTVTLHLRNTRFALGPFVAPGGAGLTVTRLNQ
jgi:membrane-associated phospholipid phosphatase